MESERAVFWWCGRCRTSALQVMCLGPSLACSYSHSLMCKSLPHPQSLALGSPRVVCFRCFLPPGRPGSWACTSAQGSGDRVSGCKGCRGRRGSAKKCWLGGHCQTASHSSRVLPQCLVCPGDRTCTVGSPTVAIAQVVTAQPSSRDMTKRKAPKAGSQCLRLLRL